MRVVAVWRKPDAKLVQNRFLKESEFETFSVEVQDELYAEAGYAEKFGPATARPHVDTLKGSSYANMKELRFEARW